MTERRIINVTIEGREGGGISVRSADLPGLVLSGKNRAAIIAGIHPAVKAILQHKGEDTNVRIDATFVSGE
jgi:hypothetical protein